MGIRVAGHERIYMGLYPKPDSPTPGKPTVYKVRDATGRLIAKHVRIDKPDGKKKVWWERPDGTSGLNGTRLGDLPLYNSQLVKGWDPDNMIVLAEGEKACEALHYAGLNTLGTVCGAGATPGPEVLEVLRDRRMCLWPDNDAA